MGEEEEEEEEEEEDDDDDGSNSVSSGEVSAVSAPGEEGTLSLC